MCVYWGRINICCLQNLLCLHASITSYSHFCRHRCCEASCSTWQCQWAEYTEYRKKFDVPAEGLFVQGMRGKYKEEQKLVEFASQNYWV